MVTRGSIRGNGKALGAYLLRKGENDSITVLDIRGTSQPGDLTKSLIEMSLTSELSRRSNKGLYHVVINPAPADSYRMTKEDWLRAASILEEETGFLGQKRTIVLHEKDSRIHAHCVYERYNHETGKMISNRHSRRKQDRARKRMEIELSHVRTPDANQERPILRKLLPELWQRYPTGKEFMKALREHGYTLARNDGRRPFAIVSAAGFDFDLARESKVKTKEIRERFNGIELPNKKQVIKSIRTVQRSHQPETEKLRRAKELTEQLQQTAFRAKEKGRGR